MVEVVHRVRTFIKVAAFPSKRKANSATRNFSVGVDLTQNRDNYTTAKLTVNLNFSLAFDSNPHHPNTLYSLSTIFYLSLVPTCQL